MNKKGIFKTCKEQIEEEDAMWECSPPCGICQKQLKRNDIKVYVPRRNPDKETLIYHFSCYVKERLNGLFNDKAFRSNREKAVRGISYDLEDESVVSINDLLIRLNKKKGE